MHKRKNNTKKKTEWPNDTLQRNHIRAGKKRLSIKLKTNERKTKR